MLEFTLLGYCLCRSSFKMWVAATHILNEERRNKVNSNILF